MKFLRGGADERLAQEQLCQKCADANGRIEATTDGLLMNRYIPCIRGPALTNGAPGVGAARTDPVDIAAYLAVP